MWGKDQKLIKNRLIRFGLSGGVKHFAVEWCSRSGNSWLIIRAVCVYADIPHCFSLIAYCEKHNKCDVGEEKMSQVFLFCFFSNSYLSSISISNY
jgi:hypothetical protein